jgi:hypothetical protein
MQHLIAYEHQPDSLGRVLDNSHATIIRGEQRLATQVDKWSPVAPTGAEVTIEGDEGYTRVGENLSPRSK